MFHERQTLIPLLAFITVALGTASNPRAGDLLIAVAPAVAVDPECALHENATDPEHAAAPELPSQLSADITRLLRAAGISAVEDLELGALLLRLDRVNPDPYDYRMTREHVTASGAENLVYVNDLRLRHDGDPEAKDAKDAGACTFLFNTALWSVAPFMRRAATADSVRVREGNHVSEAAARVAEWILQGL